MRFGKYGASLALIDIDQEKLDKVVAKLQEGGVPSEKILAVKGDVTNPDDAKKVVDAAVKTFGKLDILVSLFKRYNLRESLFTKSLQFLDQVF